LKVDFVNAHSSHVALFAEMKAYLASIVVLNNLGLTQ